MGRLSSGSRCVSSFSLSSLLPSSPSFLSAFLSVHPVGATLVLMIFPPTVLLPPHYTRHGAFRRRTRPGRVCRDGSWTVGDYAGAGNVRPLSSSLSFSPSPLLSLVSRRIFHVLC